MTEIEADKTGQATVAQYQAWAMQSYKFYMDYAKIDDRHEKGGHSFGLSVATLHQFFYEDVISPDARTATATTIEHNEKYKEIKTKCGPHVFPHADETAIEKKFGTSLIKIPSRHREARANE